MKLTKRIKAKVSGGVGRPRWYPIGYYKNRPPLLRSMLSNGIGKIESVSLYHTCYPKLNNFDTVITGTREISVCCPVPGVGPILKLFINHGSLYAIRSNGRAPVTYVKNDQDEWCVVREVVAAPGFTRLLTDGESAYPHPSGNGWIIAHPDREPLWCYGDSSTSTFRQEVIHQYGVITW